MEWINIKDRLPKDREKVIILVGTQDVQIAVFLKGRTKEEVERTGMIKYADQNGNNAVPYRWIADGGPMDWFGQQVTYWMELPNLPS